MLDPILSASPAAWLTTVTRRRAINRLRDRSRVRANQQPLIEVTASDFTAVDTASDLDGNGDDRLRLIVMCCHPSLSPEARVTLTLRLVAGLTTREIASAHVTPEATVAQRISRAHRPRSAAKHWRRRSPPATPGPPSSPKPTGARSTSCTPPWWSSAATR